jgi:hypothetical protein
MRFHESGLEHGPDIIDPLDADVKSPIRASITEERQW